MTLNAKVARYIAERKGWTREQESELEKFIDWADTMLENEHPLIRKDYMTSMVQIAVDHIEAKA